MLDTRYEGRGRREYGLTVGRFTVGQKTEDGETVDMGDGRAMMDEGGNVEFQRLDAGFRLRRINPPYGVG